jgi:hypothetical protein
MARKLRFETVQIVRTDPLMDGINAAGGKSPGSDGNCPPGYHKITVQYSPDQITANATFTVALKIQMEAGATNQVLWRLNR